MSLLNKPVFDNSIITPFDNTVAIEVGERNYQMHQDRMRSYKPDPIYIPKPDPVFFQEPEPLYISEPDPVFLPEPEPLYFPDPDPVILPDPEPLYIPDKIRFDSSIGLTPKTTNHDTLNNIIDNHIRDSRIIKKEPWEY